MRKLSGWHRYHLLARGNGYRVECNAPGAKVALNLADYHANFKGGGNMTEICCKRCHAAYERRLAVVRANAAKIKEIDNAVSV